MARDEDVFWDELGVSWQATIRDADFLSSRLKSRMKFRGTLLAAATLTAALLSVLGLALAAWALWVGWASHLWNFVTRGVTLAAVSLLTIMVSLALRSRERVETHALREMLQLSVTQTKRLIRACDLTCYSLLILTVGGLLGYALRLKLGRAAAVSLVEDLLSVTVAGLGLLWFRWSRAQALRRLECISRAFDSGDELP